MGRKSIHYYLIKTSRVSGWLLLLLMSIYIVTGFSLSSKLGFSDWIDVQTAATLHRFFNWPLVGLVCVHASITVYFALRRWGWISKRRPRR